MYWTIWYDRLPSFKFPPLQHNAFLLSQQMLETVRPVKWLGATRMRISWTDTMPDNKDLDDWMSNWRTKGNMNNISCSSANSQPSVKEKCFMLTCISMFSLHVCRILNVSEKWYLDCFSATCWCWDGIQSWK